MAKRLRKATVKMESKGTKSLFKRAANRAGLSLVAKPVAKEKDSPDPQIENPGMFAENGVRPSK